MMKYSRIVLWVFAGIFLLIGCSGGETTAPEPTIENATLPPPAVTNIPPATEEVAAVPPTVAQVTVEPEPEVVATETTAPPSPEPPTAAPAPTTRPQGDNLYPYPDLTLVGATGRPQFIQSYANW